jgi:hypothetical protein
MGTLCLQLNSASVSKEKLHEKFIFKKEQTQKEGVLFHVQMGQMNLETREGFLCLELFLYV